MNQDQTSIVFRVEKDLKTAFERIAKEEDQTVSQILRKYMRWKVEKHMERNGIKPTETTPEPPKPTEHTPTLKKAKKPPLESRDGLLSMFKKKGAK